MCSAHEALNEVIDEDENHEGPGEDHGYRLPGGYFLVCPFDGALNERCKRDAEQEIKFEVKNDVENEVFVLINTSG